MTNDVQDAPRHARNTELICEGINKGEYKDPIEILAILNGIEAEIIQAMYDEITEFEEEASGNHEGQQEKEERIIPFQKKKGE